MNSSTFRLHMALYRHAHGALRAYEEWIKANQPVDQVDPINHFKDAKDFAQQQNSKSRQARNG